MQVSDPRSTLFRTSAHPATKICDVLLVCMVIDVVWCFLRRRYFHRSCFTYIHRDPKKKKHKKKGKKCLLKRMASKETHDFQPFVKHQSRSLLPQIRSIAVAVWIHKMLRNLKLIVCRTKDQ